MRLDFNVLWVEDQVANVQSQKQKLERTIKSEGFRLKVEFANSVNDAITRLGTDVYSDHVDLILMDYDLGAGKKGDEGLKEVRNTLPYRDIVFYSSSANNLLKLVADAQVQGVYCSTRQDLPDIAQQVFVTLVKKVLDIDHSRGIVMGTTSDIDYFVNDCLMNLFNASDEAVQKKALDQVQKHLLKIRENFELSIAKISQAGHLSDLLDEHAVYTSVHRLELLRKLLKLKKLHAESDAGLSEYIQTTLPKRNLLAHVRVKVDGFNRKLIDRHGNEHTSTNMKELRLELLTQHDLFEALVLALAAPNAL